ncbi:MAG: alpha/beta hydrolase [Calditrichaeota bacterium]|nr:alpha/beta hydrolase [Calditrichota bacterium]
MSSPNSSTATDKTVRLPDGRSLGYTVCGDPEGQPVFQFHGWPGSRLQAGFLDDEAAKAGIRVIGVDRPGMGLSDFQPGRQILDWTNDVVALADAMEIDRFAVLGISGGGPYVAACAYKIPDRLTGCGILAGMGPIDLQSTEGMESSTRAIFFIARRFPWLLGPLISLSMARNSRMDEEKIERLMPKIMRKLPEPDRKVLERSELMRLFIDDSRESFRQGTKGLAYECRLYVQPWGFRLEDIAFDKVYLWQGELDVNVPVSMGRDMAEAIPNCEAKFYPNDAHLSTLFNHMKEIMGTLLS